MNCLNYSGVSSKECKGLHPLASSLITVSLHVGDHYTLPAVINFIIFYFTFQLLSWWLRSLFIYLIRNLTKVMLNVDFDLKLEIYLDWN